MTFAEDFKREAAPRLRAVAKLHGTLHALGAESFSDAHAAVHAEASYLGAGFLPAENYDDLCEQITSAVLAETQAAETVADAVEAGAVADPIAHYEDLARGDDLLRWTFAAICPEYRAHLIAERRHAG